MPFPRPTLTQIRARVSSYITSAFPGLLRFSNLSVLGEVLSGESSGHYGYLDYIARQATPFTATDEYLEGWAALKRVFRKPAAAAAGTVNFSGTNGSALPIGTPLARVDGQTYVTTAGGVIAGGIVTVPVIATGPGADGNAATGTGMTLSVGISGIGSEGIVATTIGGGADIEPNDEFRTRMLATYAAPPQGGNATDYVEWAEAVPGVTRAWVKPNSMGAGTITVYFMMDGARSAFGGFPQGSSGVAAAEPRDVAATGDQLTVANAIFDDQPVTALVYAVAPSQNVVTLTIAGIPTSSAGTRAAIAQAFGSALALNASPGGVRLAVGTGGLTWLSTIESAIARVGGTSGFVITALSASAGTITPGPTGNIQSDDGALPVAGAITFV